jgi:hypothetical protein
MRHRVPRHASANPLIRRRRFVIWLPVAGRGKAGLEHRIARRNGLAPAAAWADCLRPRHGR